MDLVDVRGVEEALRTHPDRYLRRVYSPREVDECHRAGRLDARLLAQCFAAKEAVVKVLAPASGDAVPWPAVTVRRRGGRPQAVLEGGAADLAARRGIRGLSLSITHEAHHAAAVAIAETEEAA
jgi:holo-[acyl-carrier protein] synthase